MICLAVRFWALASCTHVDELHGMTQDRGRERVGHHRAGAATLQPPPRAGMGWTARLYAPNRTVPHIQVIEEPLEGQEGIRRGEIGLDVGGDELLIRVVRSEER